MPVRIVRGSIVRVDREAFGVGLLSARGTRLSKKKHSEPS